MRPRLILGVAVLLVIGVMASVQPPAWIVLLLGSVALAVVYIVARLRSRFDPSDPRFGGCIPPITKPGDQ
jgi:4-hydroxybenzoate polyprenyltransferase